jgi:hypothetical protein
MRYSCGRCVQEGFFFDIVKDSLICCECSTKFNQEGNELIKIRYPWFPQDPNFETQNQNSFVQSGDNLKVLELCPTDIGMTFQQPFLIPVSNLPRGSKKIEFQRVSKMVLQFLERYSTYPPLFFSNP